MYIIGMILCLLSARHGHQLTTYPQKYVRTYVHVLYLTPSLLYGSVEVAQAAHCFNVHLFLFSVYTDHSHSAQIKERQSKLDVACSDLQQHCTARSQRLQESLKLQEFYRRAEEEEAWMKEKEQIVSSSEVGRGLSHVLRLVYVHVSA